MKRPTLTGEEMIRSTTVATLVCLAGLSCAKTSPTAATLRPTPTPPPAAAMKSPAPKPVIAASTFPVIVHIVSRDKTVTISSGPRGQVYSLALNDGGKVLVANATGPEFEKLHPEIYRSLRGTIAVKNNDAFLWDGVETSRSQDQLDDPIADASVDTR
jgi:hypothetical protein